MHTRRTTTIVSAVLILLVLVGGSSPVAAGFFVLPSTVHDSQTLERASDGWAYVVTDSAALNGVPPNTWLWHDEDVKYGAYAFQWTTVRHSSGSLVGPANRSVYWDMSSFTSKGWLDSGSLVPGFWTIENTTDDVDVAVGWDLPYFALALEDNVTVMMDATKMTVGILNVTTPAEFYHVILASNQDACDIWVAVRGPSGRFIVGEAGVPGGDITVVPMCYDGLGDYVFYFWPESYGPARVSLTVSVREVQPVDLVPGQIEQGVLSGSEWRIDSDSSEVLYEERVPTAITYRLTPPDGAAGRLSYVFNYPEFSTGTYDTREPWIVANANFSQSGILAFVDYLSPDDGTWWYMGVDNRSYYVTIMGLDNVKFQILNELVDVDPLPVNRDFYIESIWDTITMPAYYLRLPTDSMVCLNSTELTGGGFDWYFLTYHEGVYHATSMFDAHAFSVAYPMYLPAGDYLFVAVPQGTGASGLYRFTVGPVVDDSGTFNIDDGEVLGIRMSTEILHHYALNVTLKTNYDVRVTTTVTVIDQFGSRRSTQSALLGHYKVGFGWTAYGTNFTTTDLGLDAYTPVDEGVTFVAIKPFGTVNLTGGAIHNSMSGFTHTFDVDLVPYLDMAFNGTASLDGRPSQGVDTHSFALEEPQDNTEHYVVWVTVNPDKWYNVSVYTRDVTDMEVSLLQDVDGKVASAPWSYLDDTKSGDIPDMRLGFGSLGSRVALLFEIDRDPLVNGGYLNITVREMPTNTITAPSPPTVPSLHGPVQTSESSDILGSYGLILGGGAGAVIAAAVVVYAIRKRRGS